MKEYLFEHLSDTDQQEFHLLEKRVISTQEEIKKLQRLLGETQRQIAKLEHAARTNWEIWRNDIVVGQGGICPACSADLAYSHETWHEKPKGFKKFEIRRDVPPTRMNRLTKNRWIAYCKECAQQKGLMTHSEFMRSIGRPEDLPDKFDLPLQEDSLTAFEYAISKD